MDRFNCQLSVAIILSSAMGLRGVLELPVLHAGYTTVICGELSLKLLEMKKNNTVTDMKRLYAEF